MFDRKQRTYSLKLARDRFLTTIERHLSLKSLMLTSTTISSLVLTDLQINKRSRACTTNYAMSTTQTAREPCTKTNSKPLIVRIKSCKMKLDASGTTKHVKNTCMEHQSLLNNQIMSSISKVLTSSTISTNRVSKINGKTSIILISRKRPQTWLMNLSAK